MSLTVSLIRKKRNGEALSRDEIVEFIQGFTDGTIPDYQVTAMSMAIFFQGLNDEELMNWTEAMMTSGDVLDFSHIDGYKVDKHSTGGVGDKTSLILAPIAAAAGVYVPMISGRGLGHTGGTLDKLESIPGFTVQLTTERFGEVLENCGLVLAGQSADLVPADRKLYSLRDVTATVESIPLISSSIMSKKMAEGINGLVLDVKFGSGAFMQELDRARELARTMVSIGQRMGRKIVALLTDMNQPLGTHVGNSLEIIECCEILRGHLTNDLSELSFRLAAEMLLMGGKADDLESALALVQELIDNGSAFRKFQEIVQAQGGDHHSLEDYSLFAQASGRTVVLAPRDGVIHTIECRRVGMLAVELGAGRRIASDDVDPSVGFVFNAKVGDRVSEGDHLVTIYYNDESRIDEIRDSLEACIHIDDADFTPPPLIAEVLSS
jgi:pyrimidine-nucleoside phosphorylase